ncbi:MAG: hypothetical protein AB1568_06885 [Thermodesulfobacteriota bacterium]
MIAKKSEFSLGLVLMLGFWAVFAILMSPVFPGKSGKVNCLDFMDNLYNSISKASAYYIPKVQEKAAAYQGTEINLGIKAKNDAEAARFRNLLATAGAQVTAGTDNSVSARADIAAITRTMLADADAMFANQGEAIRARYNAEPRQALYDWYAINKAMVKTLEEAGDFKTAKILYDTQTKAIEPAYNYFGIESTPIRTQVVTVVLSLVGYVVYTLWFGFAILFMFEGWGLKLEH